MLEAEDHGAVCPDDFEGARVGRQEAGGEGGVLLLVAFYDFGGGVFGKRGGGGRSRGLRVDGGRGVGVGGDGEEEEVIGCRGGVGTFLLCFVLLEGLGGKCGVLEGALGEDCGVDCGGFGISWLFRVWNGVVGRLSYACGQVRLKGGRADSVRRLGDPRQA